VPFDPRNILVIDFGQLGDVVLSLPALRAIRERFPRAKITVAVGKPGGEIIRLAGHADDVLEVDRVALRDGAKLISIGRSTISSSICTVCPKRTCSVFSQARRDGSMRAAPAAQLMPSRISTHVPHEKQSRPTLSIDIWTLSSHWVSPTRRACRF
jgi:hypothetical protein